MELLSEAMNEKEALFKEKSKVGEKEGRRGKSEAEMKYLSSRKEPCCCFWKAPLPSRHSTWAVAEEEVHTARIFRNALQYQEWPAPKCTFVIGNKREILSVNHPRINTDIEEIFALKSPDIEGTPKRI